MEIAHKPGFTRRSVIRVFVSGGMLIAGVMPLLPAGSRAAEKTVGDLFQGGPGPMLVLKPDNTVIIRAPIPDMGTGVETALPMVLAEEFDVDWSQVSIERFTPDQVRTSDGEWVQNYVHQGTGGSASVRTAWPQLRKCGLLARSIILRAASSQLRIPVASLSTDAGFVVGGGHRYPYSDFLDSALMQSAGLVQQELVPVTSGHELPTFEIDLDGDFLGAGNRGEYSVVGREIVSPRMDLLLTGREPFGIDQSFPGQLYASIERCPYIQGELEWYDATQARAIEGVVDIVPVPRLWGEHGDEKFNAPGIAVLATSYWAAYKARKLLDTRWDQGEYTHENNSWHTENSLEALSTKEPRRLYDSGDVEAALASAHRVLDATYQAPHFAHLTMEPMNCAAWATEDSCIIAGGCQYPNQAITFLGETFRIPVENIRYLPSKLGCGFGRRARDDYVAEAVYLSQLSGKPVKVLWTREDDIQHDFFNPMSVTRFRGGLDEQGNIVAWDCLFSSQGSTRMDGFPTQLIPHMRVATVKNDSRVPLGAWRGPGHNLAGFYAEGFLNELAALAGRDPYELRMALLGEDRSLPYANWYPNQGEGGTIETGRNKAVLRAVAERAGWQGLSSAKGKGRGIASHFTFGSFVAMVVDVTVDLQKGTFAVDRVTAAVDCGLVINPSGARAQIEGGIIDGLSAVRHQHVKFEQGRVITGNFNDIRMTRMDESPREIDIVFVNQDAEPFGTGEIALPAFIPALMAALHNATGIRVRALPIGNQLMAGPSA